MTDPEIHSDGGGSEGYDSIMKETEKTMDDLRFEYNVHLSQYSMYLNAVVIIVGFTIAITSYVVINTDSFTSLDMAAIVCLSSTILSGIIGTTYCLYDMYWKAKIDPFLKRHAYRTEGMTDEKRRFIGFRKMFISVMQIEAEKEMASSAFRWCTLFFVLGFVFFTISSLISADHPLLIFLLCVPIIIVAVWNEMELKGLKKIVRNSGYAPYDLIRGLFFEEKLDGLEETVAFSYLVSRKKECNREMINTLAKKVKRSLRKEAELIKGLFEP